MSNAAKHRKKAAEFEQLKQIDRAIASYIRAIEESESEGADVDVALFNKVGDLTLRQGRVADAVTYYERAVEHYATAGLFNNAIALCNKILRSAPGRANVYFTLGRICAKKGLRGDATRNFLEYATRMQQDGRVEEGMRALAEVADLMPELTEVRRLVEEHAERAGITLPRRKTPSASTVAQVNGEAAFKPRDNKSSELIFLDIGDTGALRRMTPPLAPRVRTPARNAVVPPSTVRPGTAGSASLDDFLLFDPSRPGAVTPPDAQRPIVAAATPIDFELTDAVLEPTSAEPPAVEATRVDIESIVITPIEIVEPVSTAGTEDLSATVESALTSFDDTEPSVDLPMIVELPEPSPLALVEPLAAPVAESFHDLAPATDEATVDDSATVSADGDGDASMAAAFLQLIEGLEATLEFDESAVESVEGLTATDESIASSTADAASSDAAIEPISWLDVPEIPEAVELPEGLEVHAEVALEDRALVDVITDLVVEDFEHVADSVDVVRVTDTRTGTPIYSSTIARSLTPLDVSPIPELEAAIEAGALAAARAEADPEIALRRPPFRLDPHDFILPGELPPLVVDDDTVDAGLERAMAAHLSMQAEFEPQSSTVDAQIAAEQPLSDAVLDRDVAVNDIEREDVVPEREMLAPDVVDDALVADLLLNDDLVADTDPLVTPPFTIALRFDSAPEADDAHDIEVFPAESATPAPNAGKVDAAFETELDADFQSVVELSASSHEEPTERAVVPAEEAAVGADADVVDIVDVDVALVADEATGDDATPGEAIEAIDATEEAALRSAIEQSVQPPDVDVAAPTPTRAVSTTPALPIAAVAAEANAVATTRRDALRASVTRAPQDWILRRRLAEALFEAGEREGGLTELQTALSGFAQHGHLGAAADVADELVRISPDRIPYHQKRVELAVRLSDQSRLRVAYLDLADTLVRGGDEVRAHTVYTRVLEIDPWDERARAALGSAAPPPPPKPASDEEFVDLADWLRDDAPVTTRMRMPEPKVSGDEQADFDSLLRHFKEGVARSLGEEDYESHYDLGVAYKEMGLLDDAIAEFQKALRSLRHRLPAYEALGQCFVEQSRHSVAATVLTRALHEPGLGDEQRIGVLYLLAYSCEALQRWDEARSYYSRVYATDINFRDVAARVAALDQLAR